MRTLAEMGGREPQADEVRTFYVPMRLFGDQREIDGIGQPRIEQLDHGGFGVGFDTGIGVFLQHDGPFG